MPGRTFKGKPRVYRIPKDQVDRLPDGESGPYLPYDAKDHGFYVYENPPFPNPVPVAVTWENI